jgi:ammonia channel protein AmtB
MDGIGFAAVCTAGILLPLDWIMGIRLAKEDEMRGLDATGNVVFSLGSFVIHCFDRSTW